MTFQGAGNLDYKLMTLANGVNKLAIPMAVKLAPNFNLGVAVMTEPGERPAQRRAAKAGRFVSTWRTAPSPSSGN